MAGLTKIESGGIGDNCDFDGSGTLKLDSTNDRVGVGITSPSHKLTVLHDNTAALKVGGNGSHAAGYHLELGQLGTNTSAGIKYTGSGGSMMIHNSSGEVARFRPDGELLLNHGAKHGTNARSSWYSWLHVKGNAYADTSDGRISLTSGASLSGTAAIGSIYFADLNGGDRVAIRAHQDGAGNSSDNFPGRLSFWTNSGTSNATEKMCITSSGNVGINTTAPTRQLEVSSATHATAALKGEDQSSLFFVDSADSNIGQISYVHADNAMYFRVNDQERVRIDSSGNVGVGATAPVRKFEVKVSDSTDYNTDFQQAYNCLALRNATDNKAVGLEFKIGTNGQAAIGAVETQDGNTAIVFGTRDTSGTRSEKMRLSHSGRLGIGCTPVRDLQLHTPDASSELMLSNSTTGATAGSGFMIQQDGNDNYIWNKENSFMSFGTNATEQMRLANSGELLIGTTTAPGRGELLKVEKKTGGTEGSGIKLSGTYSLPDDGSQTFNVGNCALIFIAENNTGDGAMFFCTYKASAVSKVSDPHDRYANSDTDGKICVFKTAESHAVVLKNRCGATKSFTIGKINTSD